MLNGINLNILRDSDSRELPSLADILDTFAYEHPDLDRECDIILDHIVGVVLEFNQRMEAIRNESYDEGFSEGKHVSEVRYEYLMDVARDEAYQEGFDEGFEVGKYVSPDEEEE